MDERLRVEVRVELKDSDGCIIDGYIGSTELMQSEWARAGFGRIQEAFPVSRARFEFPDEYPDDENSVEHAEWTRSLDPDDAA